MLGKAALSRVMGILRKSLTPIFTHAFQGYMGGNKKVEYKAILPSGSQESGRVVWCYLAPAFLV